MRRRTFKYKGISIVGWTHFKGTEEDGVLLVHEFRAISPDEKCYGMLYAPWKYSFRKALRDFKLRTKKVFNL